MAAQALPPPGQGAATAGGAPGGGSPSPSTPQPDPGAGQILELVRTIVSASRLIGQRVPGAIPIVRQINDLVQQLQMKILQSQPGQEQAAPPS